MGKEINQNIPKRIDKVFNPQNCFFEEQEIEKTEFYTELPTHVIIDKEHGCVPERFVIIEKSVIPANR